MATAMAVTGSVKTVTTWLAAVSSRPSAQPPSARSRFDRTRLPCDVTTTPPPTAAPQPMVGRDCPAAQPGNAPVSAALVPIAITAIRSVAAGTAIDAGAPWAPTI